MEGTGSCPRFNWEARDLVGEWNSFKDHVSFMFKGPLKAKSEEEKCSYLMLWVGEKGRKIFSTWTLSDEQQKKLQNYYDGFKAYVQPKSNPIFARYKFHSKVQAPDETCEQFVTELKLLVKECEYGDKEDEVVRDRIVFGTKSDKVREKLIDIGKDLTLEKAIEIARVDEMSVKQLKEMNLSAEAAVHAVRHRERTNAQKTSRSCDKNKGTHAPSEHRATAQKKCGRCGMKHTQDAQCPAIGKECRKCMKPNHFASMCRARTEQTHSSKRRNKVHTLDDSDSSDTEDEVQAYSLGTIGTAEMNTVDSGWFQKLEVEEKTVNFQLDTGAKCNVISEKTFKSFKGKKLEKSKVKLTSYSGHNIKTLGSTKLTCKFKKEEHEVKFYVTEMDSTAILGLEACQRLGLIQRVDTVQSSMTQEVKGDHPQLDVKGEYPDSFEGLGCLPGEVHLKVDPDVQPVVHAPRKIPVALHKKVKSELKRMEKEGVITRQEEPTDWVNSMVVVETSKKTRICIDPRDLNKAIKREHYPMKTIEEVVQNMPGAKVFSKLDATSGYWQLKLDEESSKLCTFNTPWGRYRFLRLPFGIVSASEIFQRVMSQMVEDIEGTEAVMDDVVVSGSNTKEHDKRLKKVMEKAKSYGLTFNDSKCEFHKSEISYVGHILSGEGLKADPEKIRAVQKMSSPQNKKELMTFLGFIQYLGKFLPNLADVSKPLRKLTEKDAVWKWTKTEEESFKKLKKLVTEAPVLRYYDPAKPLTLSVDASSTGLGCCLMQEGQPIAYGSRALTKTQQNYAQIEKETLAVVYGCEKFHTYVYGRTVEVETDHKPLQSIFTKPLHKAPVRLQRFMLQLQKYDLKVKYKPGKEMYVADTLSRSYLPETKEQLIPEKEINAINPRSHLPISDEKYAEFQRETANDVELTELKKVILKGFPENRRDVPESVRAYWSFRDELTYTDGLIFRGLRLVIPKKLQVDQLQRIHSSHLGIVKCKSMARELVFWIGMSSQIEDMVTACRVCAENSRANSKEPMIPMDIPDRPWAKIAADLFELNKTHYLIIVDYYSKWPEVITLNSLNTKTVVGHMKSQFARFGIVDELITDNGPQFASAEFAEFMKEYEIKHTTTSPYHPQGNGQAERMVQTVKNLMKKSKDPHRSLLDYRNTPLDTGKSPAELFLGRKLKTTLPTRAELLKPGKQQNKKNHKDLIARQKKQKEYFDRKASGNLTKLRAGDPVMMQFGNRWKKAEVVTPHSTPRSYVVRDEQNVEYRRNRKMLRPTKVASRDSDSNRTVTIPTTDQNVKDSNQKEKEKKIGTEQIPVQTDDKNMVENKDSAVTTRSGRVVKQPKKYSDEYT
ncbi:hypothetical protein V1264_017967 [Littorina saxatilis]|uniref:Endonuclease n=1 Tax=Littorina saxatilis TaxID=31220 RepID=A0AAN9BKF2_9CAEN